MLELHIDVRKELYSIRLTSFDNIKVVTRMPQMYGKQHLVGGF